MPLMTPNTISSNCRENMSAESLKLLSTATLMPLLQRIRVTPWRSTKYATTYNAAASTRLHKSCNTSTII